jgi:amino-acid N-acetyltransferase
MPAAPAIRQADPADAPAISAVIQQHVASGLLLPRTPEFIAERATDFLVAVEGDRVVGCVHLSEYSPSLAEVRSLAADAAHDATDVRERLLDAAEQLAARRGYPTLFAVTNDEAFFRGRGYAPGAVPELYPETEEVSRFAGVLAKELG